MISPTQFVKIAPYLHNYFVLIGFIVFVVAGILYAILTNSHRAKLSNSQKLTLWLAISRDAFWLGIICVLSGLGYTAIHKHENSNPVPAQSAPIQQQGGDCTILQNGTGNSASVNCPDKKAGAK
jgi:hypothetical protein